MAQPAGQQGGNILHLLAGDFMATVIVLLLHGQATATQGVVGALAQQRWHNLVLATVVNGHGQLLLSRMDGDRGSQVGGHGQ